MPMQATERRKTNGDNGKQPTSFMDFLFQCLRSRKPSKVEIWISAISAFLGFLVWSNPNWLPGVLHNLFQETKDWLVWVVVFGGEFFYRLFMSPYWLHLSSQQRIWELEKANTNLQEAFVAKLAIKCASNIDGCAVPFGHAGHGRIFRVSVRNCGVAPIRECRAFLVCVESGGKKLWSGDQVNLSWAPSEDPDSECKNLLNSLDYYLDVVGIEVGTNTPWNFRPGTKNHKWNIHPQFNQLFMNGEGDYVFTISIGAPSIPTVTHRFLLRWTGNFQTSDMQMLD